MISDEKFYEKATKFVLLKNVEKETFTLADYREKVDVTQKDKHDRTVMIYANDPASQDAAITAAKKQGYDVLLLDHIIDNHFLQTLEQKESKLTFVRIDSDTVDNLVQKDETKESVLNEEQTTTVKELFSTVAGEGKAVEVKPLSPDEADNAHRLGASILSSALIHPWADSKDLNDVDTKACIAGLHSTLPLACDLPIFDALQLTSRQGFF